MSQTAAAKGIEATVMVAGQPLHGASVTLWRTAGKDTFRSLAEATTDARGGFGRFRR